MLILASQSRIRAALLANAGLAFAIRPAALDERALEAGAPPGPQGLARHLAEAKARSVSQGEPGAVVIGADQVLALDGEVLHKVADLDGARARLDRLKGRAHHLHAGVAIARAGEVLWSHVETARLVMRDFSDAERDLVLALEGPEVLASVAAYRLEGPSIRLFSAVEGDYFTILGLPLLALLGALRIHAPQLLDR
jgi:septum formation protein